MNPRASDSTQVTFTERGEAALDEFAAALTAKYPPRPGRDRRRPRAGDERRHRRPGGRGDRVQSTAADTLGVTDSELAIARRPRDRVGDSPCPDNPTRRSHACWTGPRRRVPRRAEPCRVGHRSCCLRPALRRPGRPDTGPTRCPGSCPRPAARPGARPILGQRGAQADSPAFRTRSSRPRPRSAPGTNSTQRPPRPAVVSTPAETDPLLPLEFDTRGSGSTRQRQVERPWEQHRFRKAPDVARHDAVPEQNPEQAAAAAGGWSAPGLGWVPRPSAELPATQDPWTAR